MPGTAANYLGSGSSALTKMLYQPIPGLDSGGFDTLSEGYDSAETTGISDLQRRGLTTTGATPELQYGLGQAYNRGAAQVNQQGTAEQQQQRLAILNAMLGLGSAGLTSSRANVGSTLEDLGFGAEGVTGLFGAPTGGNFLTGQGASPGGLLSGDLRNLLSKLGF